MVKLDIYINNLKTFAHNKKTTDIIKEKLMCKDAKILLVVSALFTFAMGLSNVFVNVYFWRETGNFLVIVLYNLTHYITTPIAFVFGGILAKRKNGMWSLRIGLMLYAIFYVLVLILGSKGNLYIYMLGLLYGLASGFYWLAYNTLSFDYTCISNRDTFNGYNGCCGGITAAIAPITAAYIISRYTSLRGYTIVFTITLMIFVLLMITSSMIKCKNYDNKIDIKMVFSKINDQWSIILKATALWGFRDVIIAFVINILIIQTTGSELSLGKLTLLSSLISSGSFVLVQRVIKPPKRKLSTYLGTVGIFIAVWGIAYKVAFSTLVIYIIMDALFLPFFTIQLSSSTFNVIDKTNEENMRIEYMISKDLALNGGRIVSSLILLMLLSIFKSLSVIKIYLLFIAAIPLFSAYYLRKVLE